MDERQLVVHLGRILVAHPRLIVVFALLQVVRKVVVLLLSLDHLVVLEVGWRVELVIELVVPILTVLLSERRSTPSFVLNRRGAVNVLAAVELGRVPLTSSLCLWIRILHYYN